MYEQMTIFDIPQKQEDFFPKAYEVFHEHCKYRGWHKKATETEPSMWMCGKNAKCWADWIPCDVENCPLRRGNQ